MLRQFVETGGLVVVADGINMLTPFLNNTGLMSVTQNVFYSGMRPTTLVSTHPITQDMPTTFVTKTYINIYSSVGDAQPLALDTTLSGPTVAIKSIGPGNVLCS